jgi:hypothetical protein
MLADSNPSGALLQENLGWRFRAYKMVDPHTGNMLRISLSSPNEITANGTLRFPTAAAQMLEKPTRNPSFAPFAARKLSFADVSSINLRQPLFATLM